MVGAILSRTPNYGFAKVRFDVPGWHGVEHDNWALVDGLLSSIGSVPGSRGIWINAEAYIIGDRVVDPDSGGLYRCSVAHTSAVSGTFAADRAANPTYWTLITQVPIQTGAWVTATAYNTQDMVTHSNAYYYCVEAHTSGVFATDLAAGKWELIFDTQPALDAEAAAAASEAAAALSETNAAASESAAAASAGTAASEAAAAAASESAASGSASAAATSAGNAATSETNAATSETNAATSETNAANSAADAAADAGIAAAAAAVLALGTFGDVVFKAVSTTNAELQPVKTGLIFIDGANRKLTTAAVLTNASTSAGALRYVYAYLSSGVITLEASATAPATDATYGHKIKTGDATRTLVGLIHTITGNLFLVGNAIVVRSWFNEDTRSLRTVFGGQITSGTTNRTELHNAARANITTWANEEIIVTLGGYSTVTPAANAVYTGIGFDSVTSNHNTGGYNQPSTNNYGGHVGGTTCISGVTVGNHYITALGHVSGGTGTWEVDLSITIHRRH